jgi:hypothetical protein
MAARRLLKAIQKVETMLTRRQFGAGFGFLALAALVVLPGCDDGDTGARTEETEKEAEAARNASIEAMKKRGKPKGR